MQRKSASRGSTLGALSAAVLAGFVVWVAAGDPDGAAKAAVKTAKERIFRLADPFGDDHGAGDLAYPLRSDLEPGDLDLLELSAYRRDEGTVFRALFAREIRQPGAEAIDSLGTAREDEARLGFYTFNLDLYVDVDRQPASGNVAMLPGRKAEVAPPFAWEKVVVLTPRPGVLRASLEKLRVREWKDEEELRRTVRHAEVRRRRRQVHEELLPLLYFPRQVRVRGRQIEFFVPEAFLGGAASPDWAYVVAVTGARLEQRLELPFFGALSRESSDGLVLPIVPFRGREAFGGGRENAPLEPPIVDLLIPSGARFTQEQILGDFDSYQERPAQVPGIVPAEWSADRQP